jgi:hypothetical protein
MEGIEFKASLDTMAKIVTLGAVVLFVAIGQKSVRVIWFQESSTMTIVLHGGLLLFFLAITLGSYLYAPRSYAVDTAHLTIYRLGNNVRIRLTDIAEVRAVSDSEMNGVTRTFAVGGFFGYFGKYYAPHIGHMTWYATQRKNRVLVLTTQGDKIIITPDDMSIVEHIQAKLTQDAKP